ncbi:MAG: ribosome maturation factor RimP [Deltaproteobacteria bacterium]|nr:ribosome maturation factor RimP [Deltaproteobacteria bacterium]
METRKTPDSQIAAKVEQLVAGPLAREGLDLMDVEYRMEEGVWIVRLLLDKPGGVNLDDCGRASRLAGGILEEADVIPHAFNLEASSPGLFRPLRKPRDFTQVVGRPAKIKLEHAFMPGRKPRVFRAVIGKADDTGVEIEMDGRRETLPYTAIKTAKLDPDLKTEAKAHSSAGPV